LGPIPNAGNNNKGLSKSKTLS